MLSKENMEDLDEQMQILLVMREVVREILSNVQRILNNPDFPFKAD